MTTTKRETWQPPTDHGFTALFSGAIRVVWYGLILVVVFGVGYMIGGAS